MRTESLTAPRRRWIIIFCFVLGGCTGEIFSSVGDGPRFDESPTPDRDVPAAFCPGADPDVAARNGWRSSDAAVPTDGVLRFEVKARATAEALNGLVAVGAEEINDFDEAALAVRFAGDGLVDVRDGGFYTSDLTYPYEPGVWYSIEMIADIDAQTYDVAIGPCGEARETLIEDASFRSITEELSAWAVWSSQTAALEVSTPTWMASGGCVPATCASLNHECGQLSDGCGGTLDCGGCDSTELCDSGLCVEELVTTPAPPACVPDTCKSLHIGCGIKSDGCGGYVSCGGCEAGDRCYNDWCVPDPNAARSPSAPACVPDTCQSLGRECGGVSNGCGGSLSCGSCQSGYSCTAGDCIKDPVSKPPSSCVPDTCQSLDRQCGTVSNGCGGTLNCGGCSSGYCDGGDCVQPPPSPPSGQPGRPWSHNTGPSNPGALRSSGTVRITTNGAVVENINISGLLKIEADNVTVRNFRVRASSHYGIQVASGSNNVLIEDGEILGAESTNVYVMSGASNVTIRRLWSHHSNADHIKFEGSNLLVESSFFEKACADGDGHCDGVQSKKGKGATFRYNNFFFPAPGTPDYPGSPFKCNTPFQVEDSATGFVIDSNWVNGGNYSFNCKQSGSMAVTNNVLGRSYKYGVKAGNCSPWSGNTWEDTGGAVR